MKDILAFITVLLLFFVSCSGGAKQSVASAKTEQPQDKIGQTDDKIDDEDGLFLYRTVDLTQENLQLFWKDDNDQIFGSFQRLKNWLHQKDEKLIFAMNGGMYLKNRSPQGLYIENQQLLHPTNKVQKAYGNFYLQPNGIFYITNNHQGGVCKTKDFPKNGVKYATQSGPMLVVDGIIHPKFNESSTSKYIRNGVGILPDGQVLLAMTKEKINLFNFAQFFKNNGCQNALYLDGFISKSYYPAADWADLGGHFGVIIGITAPNKNKDSSQ